MEKLSNSICNSIWWGSSYDWTCLDVEGNSRGILLIWDDKLFGRTSAWWAKGVLVVNEFKRNNISYKYE